MTLSDLKNGYVVKTRANDYGVVHNGSLLFEDGYLTLDHYTEEMKCIGQSQGDIIEVLEKRFCHNLSELVTPDGGVLLYKELDPITPLVKGKVYYNDDFLFEFDHLNEDGKVMCSKFIKLKEKTYNPEPCYFTDFEELQKSGYRLATLEEFKLFKRVCSPKNTEEHVTQMLSELIKLLSNEE